MRIDTKPAPSAVALTAFRILPNGEGRQYSATTFPKGPWQGCERTIRTANTFGYLADDGSEGYAVLDVLDENGDIVQDFTIIHARAFKWFKRKLNWCVEDDEA